jgi:hypothetical protein
MGLHFAWATECTSWEKRGEAKSESGDTCMRVKSDDAPMMALVRLGVMGDKGERMRLVADGSALVTSEGPRMSCNRLRAEY